MHLDRGVAAERDAARSVVTWNGVGPALRYTPRQFERWEEDGEREFTNARTGQRMSIDFPFVVDVRSVIERSVGWE